MISKWGSVKVEDIAEVRSGKRLPKGQVLISEPTAHPYIRLVDVDNGRVQSSNLQYLSVETRASIKRYVVNTDDICLAIVGHTIGMVFYIEDQWDDVNLTENAARITNLSSSFNPRFIYYYLTSPIGQQEIISRKVGSAQGKLPLYNIKSLEIPNIPRIIQDKVVGILDSLSLKYELNAETNQTLEEMAQAIFKSWFVDFDPVKAKMNGEQPEGMDAATASLFPEKLVESELGLIPEGWDACLIENVTSKVFSGGTPATKNDEFWGGDLPWFSSGETRNNFIIETEKYITEAGVKGSSTKASAYGDILIASAGQGHTRGQTSFNSIDCYINQSVVALRAASNVSAYWLYYCLERRYDEMRSVSDSHSSRGSLTTKLLKGMPAIRPSKDIVNAFDRLVEPLVRKQIANSNQNRELSALRDTLLPKLLSGEIELGTEAGES
ncbi:restriction endonuclease subunit S [Vibrio harveyi]|uniref:restriction endonuclease subunit S n=1 Tax=Vibrio harveyi TaxID=669 RepID=UPI0018F27064|nr:restriction endonuclease subunit S [Vibrio harveyi]